MRIESLVATCNRNTLALYDVSTLSFEEIISKLDPMRISQTSNAGDGPDLTQSQGVPSLAKPERSATADSWAYLKLGSQQTNSCRSKCYCRCHGKRTSRFRIAPFNSIVGSLALVYSGFTLARQHCDIPSCRNFRTWMVEVTYHSPH